MKLLTLPTFAACGLAIFSTARADTPAAVESPELKALEAAYQNQLQTLKNQYRAKLEAEQKLEVQKGDLAGAVAVRDKLRTLDAPTAASDKPGGDHPVAAPPATAGSQPSMADSPYVGGRWIDRPGESVMEFKADGSWSEMWRGKKGQHGHWTQNEKKGTIDVTPEKNPTKNPPYQYIMNADGSCTRLADNQIYTKMTGQTPGGSSPPSDGKKINPFGTP